MPVKANTLFKYIPGGPGNPSEPGGPVNPFGPITWLRCVSKETIIINCSSCYISHTLLLIQVVEAIAL